MWTDRIGFDQAAATQTVRVPADETRVVQAYVVLPQGAPTGDFTFTLTSLDEQRETDREETSFKGPGDI